MRWDFWYGSSPKSQQVDGRFSLHLHFTNMMDIFIDDNDSDSDYDV